MKQNDLLLINPPSLLEKPDIGYGGGLISHTELSDKVKVRAMNPGILSIASNVHQNGYFVHILDLSNDSDLQRLRVELAKNSYRYVGVSSTSGFDYSEALACARVTKEENSEAVTIIGGQHAGPLGKKVLEDSSYIDIVCLYEGEKVVQELLAGKSLEEVKGIAYRHQGHIEFNHEVPVPFELDELAPFNFELYPNFRNFAPFVEESRGCFAQCDYCTSAYMNQGHIRLKSVDKILAQIEEAVKLWGKDPLYILSAATFGVKEQHMQELTEGLKEIGINWTTEFRADLPWYNHIEALHESGLRVAVVGMESASQEILLRMNKTKNPDKYIKSMEKAISACQGIDNLTLRLNFMIYVGETPDTVQETLDFISRNRKGIDAILYTPIFINPGTKLSKELAIFEKSHGTKIIRSPYWDERHIHLCHPSKYFSFEECLTFCDMMEKVYSTEKGWLESERFHYLEENVSEKDILELRFSRRDK